MNMINTEFKEVLDCCHIIRDGIIWIAETFLYERQYIGREVPLDVANDGGWIKRQSPECVAAYV